MWHVSIACQGKRGPELVSSLDKPTKRFMVELARSLLEGVGDGQDYLGAGDCAIHFRRSLSPVEIAGLPQEWLAIEAVDMAGELTPVDL